MIGIAIIPIMRSEQFIETHCAVHRIHGHLRTRFAMAVNGVVRFRALPIGRSEHQKLPGTDLHTRQTHSCGVYTVPFPMP